MQASPRATSFLLREVGGGDNASVDRSTNILTGMIIAALYVILLVGFVRESYTYRDAALLDSEKVSGISWRDIPKSACRIDPALCRQSETVAASRPRDMWQVIRDDR